MSAVAATAGGGTRLAVRVQPRASRSGIAGWHGEALRVRLQAPPVDGAANAALVRLLAEALGLPRERVRLLQGTASRAKTVEIAGLGPDAVLGRLGLAPPP